MYYIKIKKTRYFEDIIILDKQKNELEHFSGFSGLYFYIRDKNIDFKQIKFLNFNFYYFIKYFIDIDDIESRYSIHTRQKINKYRKEIEI